MVVVLLVVVLLLLVVVVVVLVVVAVVVLIVEGVVAGAAASAEAGGADSVDPLSLVVASREPQAAAANVSATTKTVSHDDRFMRCDGIGPCP